MCALLVKDGLQRDDPDLKYVGFRIPPDFVVGYGLDVGRALPQPARRPALDAAERERRRPAGSLVRA